jgi:hydroxymethylpyrimidine/phosphomethylpyrimidine kinase
MVTALTIAGFDPSGGAGLQADLRVFHLFGVYGLSVVSSLTAQNSSGVDSVLPVDNAFVKRQLTVLMADMRPDAVKTGMLLTEENVEVVSHIVRRYSLRNVVVDPVMVSSGGTALSERGTPEAVRKMLLPLCTLITPNISEAGVLTGLPVRNRAEMERAALKLADYGCENVIITGGHLDKVALDVVYTGDFHYLRSRKVEGEYHGTGCFFSAALTALLARGHSVPEAARLAKKFMNKVFTKTFTPGKGMRLFGI